MNERTEFLQYFRNVFVTMVDRLEAMTETEVLNGLLQVKIAREVYREEFLERIQAIQAEPPQRLRAAGAPQNTLDAFAYLSSIHVFVNSLNKLKSHVGQSAGPRDKHVYTGPARSIFGSLEVALNDRLETLRRKPSNS